MAKPLPLFLVEDEVLVQDWLDTELSSAGFDVIVAGNGVHALAELETAGPRFAALVTDIDLGSGPDGWEVSRRARELVFDMPIVYITGKCGDEWPSKGVPNSIVVSKPFAAEKLIAAVSRLLTLHPLTDPMEDWSEPANGDEVSFTATDTTASVGREGGQPVNGATVATENSLDDRHPDVFRSLETPSLRVSLKTSDDIFSAAVNATRMAMAVTDPRQPDNPIVYANTSFFETTGYSPEEVIGRNCRFLQGPDTDPKALEQIRHAIANKERLSLDILNYRKDGSAFWNGLFLEPFFDQSGALSYWFSSQADYTQHDLEHKRRKAHQLEGLQQLARGIAHDLHNLMHVVLGNLASLRRSEPDEGRGQQLDAIADAVERGGSLTRQLIAFSDTSKLARIATDMNELVKQLAAVARTTLGQKHQIMPDLAPGLWIADVDAGLVQTNLLNLILNAFDAMPEGGEITLTTRNFIQPSRDRRISRALSPGRYVLVKVQDNGTGMDPEVLKHAMVPNFTTKTPGKGSGLGLAMVFSFMRQSGGDVVIASTPGVGTSVSLYFPAFHEQD